MRNSGEPLRSLFLSILLPSHLRNPLPASSTRKSLKVSKMETSSFYTLYKLPSPVPSLASHSRFQSYPLNRNVLFAFITMSHPAVISGFPPRVSPPWQPSLSFPRHSLSIFAASETLPPQPYHLTPARARPPQPLPPQQPHPSKLFCASKCPHPL